MLISLLAINTRLIDFAILLMVAWFEAYETESLDLFFPGCHSRILFTFITPVFSITIDTDMSLSGFQISGRFRARKQRFSGSFSLTDLRCRPHISHRIFTVILDARLSFSIFPICDVSVELISE